MNTQRITAIIPAYNEAETIEGVIIPILASPFIHEVIVVSDGSSDETCERARTAGAQVYELPHQQGKGSAMLFGVSQTASPLIVFFDADLRGLTTTHVEQLIMPVRAGTLQMHVGLRDRGKCLTALSAYLPLISGERILHRSIIEAIPKKFLEGYMVEVALNAYCRAQTLSYGATPLVGLSIRRKYEKVGMPLAVLQYGRMFYQVGRAMIMVRLARFTGKF